MPLLQDYVLLCEGGGDDAFFRHLLAARSIPGFSIVFPRPDLDPGGVSGYASRLRALKLEPGFASVKGVLIIGDNDGDPQSSFGNLRKQVEYAGDFSVPVMDPKSWTQKWPFLRWSAALKMKESQCHERVRVTHPA
jgi:hypothetical protein